MMQRQLFSDDNPKAARQPKTDRLVLSKDLAEAAKATAWLNEQAIDQAHEILLRWADLESSGRLLDLGETQLQGDFLGQVFGQALGYARATENAPMWHL